MKRILIMGLVLVTAALAALAVASCESADNAAARRAEAEAAQTRANAEAYQTRQQADTQAAAERAAIRESARQAGHERALELLPYVVAILGGVLLAGLAGLMFWDLRSQRQAQNASTDAAILLELRRLELAQAERDRQMWSALAILGRRHALPSGDRKEVVIYGDNRR